MLQRISKSFNYEAALLGLVNDELDPGAQINVWRVLPMNISGSRSRRCLLTVWEAEVDCGAGQQCQVNSHFCPSI